MNFIQFSCLALHKLTPKNNWALATIGIITLLSNVSVKAVTTDSLRQEVTLDGNASAKRFDGIGVVNGGGATSVLLKDYPEKQRNQILDLVYKPLFGASVSALLVEIPGDGNSTQGSMPSHERKRGEVNYHRGYTWWILTEAKKRNPMLTLDATAWSAPGWIGNGTFFSQDAADYYVNWLKGLRDVYGLQLDAIGCRNEKGVNYDFAKTLRKSLNAHGFSHVKLHAFDNWPGNKLDFVDDMAKDKELQDAIDVISAHILYEGGEASHETQRMAEEMGKPIWNSEDHVYKKDFDCLISLVQCFNHNYIRSGATKVVNWYDIAGIYPMEPYAQDPPVIHAFEPWSGHYNVRKALWGYAHYGQFTQTGWNYLQGGCIQLEGGGSMVTLVSPDRKDYSIIIETKGAKETKKVTISLKGGMPEKSLCVWQSDSSAQFVRQEDIKPEKQSINLTLKPNTVYTLSTTRGQQKGTFSNIPQSKAFPFPYCENFEEYGNPKERGYLPRYTADISGAFEITDRPDGKGKCMQQKVEIPAISWAPDWNPYTIYGDSAWKDYEVSADIKLNSGDAAAVMGRICDVGSGYGIIPKGYYLQINDKGECKLVVVRGKIDKKKLVGDMEQQAYIMAYGDNSVGGEKTLATVQLKRFSLKKWYNLRLRFEGNNIKAYVDDKQIATLQDEHYNHGMAGLMALQFKDKTSTPFYDNIKVSPIK